VHSGVKIITLSASANNLTKVTEQSEEYARLIMEELDPSNLGYIEVINLDTASLNGAVLLFNGKCI
jgi:respiratory burst oxidase